MNFDPQKLRELLQVMRDAGVDSFEFDNLKVEFGAPNRLSVTAETPEERLERLKRDFKLAEQDASELEDWST